MKTNQINKFILIVALILSVGMWGQAKTVTATFPVDNFFAVYKGNDFSVSEKLMPSGSTLGIENGASQLQNPSTQSFHLITIDCIIKSCFV